MKVKLLTDWADHKEGSIIDILDDTVVFAGLEKGVFEEAEDKAEEEARLKAEADETK
ncbi:hypothetical protein [Flavobacterium covae]|uniref:hypothetical protein n=1 Tax=Flavobacterium covae TaxID=2906076 RepID=UPI0013FD269F|nr:hypothetical protein [Flavobacterium covae]